MTKSPGHAQWPEHRITERRLGQRLLARVNGEVVAESEDVVRVDEDGNPARYYFPRTDVRMDQLQASSKRTTCPFKGVARYFDVVAGGRTLVDAAWSYESPYEEHAALKGRIAFHGDEQPEIEIETG